MLINDYQTRQQRSQEKQQRLLFFLRDETWSSVSIIAQWLGLSLSATYKTLHQLEKKKLIKPFYVVDLKLNIWGITPDGLLHSWSEDEPMQKRQYFQPSKIKPVMINHHLDLQQARLNAEHLGIVQWQLGTQLPKNVGKRPDAIATFNHHRIAVELERTVKTKKRYEVVFAEYLLAIKQGKYTTVHYVCPSNDFASRLSRLFDLIITIPVAGERVKINNKHRSKFEVYSIDKWPGDSITIGEPYGK